MRQTYHEELIQMSYPLILIIPNKENTNRFTSLQKKATREACSQSWKRQAADPHNLTLDTSYIT